MYARNLQVRGLLIHTLLLKEAVGKSRRDAMFIEKLAPVDLGEPIYGRTIVGCAPKGATTSQLCLPFYRHFTATRFPDRLLQAPPRALEYAVVSL